MFTRKNLGFFDNVNNLKASDKRDKWINLKLYK